MRRGPQQRGAGAAVEVGEPQVELAVAQAVIAEEKVRRADFFRRVRKRYSHLAQAVKLGCVARAPPWDVVCIAQDGGQHGSRTNLEARLAGERPAGIAGDPPPRPALFGGSGA